jgi:23S rRNA pseudouridine1911/1915/1917 synthase
MLHARTLGFVHPRTGERVLFEREAPADFQAMLERLRCPATGAWDPARNLG